MGSCSGRCESRRDLSANQSCLSDAADDDTPARGEDLVDRNQKIFIERFRGSLNGSGGLLEHVFASRQPAFSSARRDRLLSSGKSHDR